MKIFLSENAFVAIATAAVETFPQETLGTLIGFPNPEKILVQLAVPYQTADRTEIDVSPNPNRSGRMERFLHRVTLMETVGDFHSHPSIPLETGYKLSKEDKASTMIEGLGLVVVINRDSIERAWEHMEKGSLWGSVYPFSLRLTSWYKNDEGRFEIASIHCPYALGLGL